MINGVPCVIIQHFLSRIRYESADANTRSQAKREQLAMSHIFCHNETPLDKKTVFLTMSVGLSDTEILRVPHVINRDVR